MFNMYWIRLSWGYRVTMNRLLNFTLEDMLIWSTLEGWKAESILEPPSGFYESKLYAKYSISFLNKYIGLHIWFCMYSSWVCPSAPVVKKTTMMMMIRTICCIKTIHMYIMLLRTWALCVTVTSRGFLTF